MSIIILWWSVHCKKYKLIFLLNNNQLTYLGVRGLAYGTYFLSYDLSI